MFNKPTYILVDSNFEKQNILNESKSKWTLNQSDTDVYILI